MKNNVIFNSKDKKLSLIIVLGTYFVYANIGWLFKTDALNAITIYRTGIGISFIGILLLFCTSLLVGYIVERMRKNR